MTADLKPYFFTKGTSAGLDEEFSSAAVYGKVKPGNTALFWKSGLRWYQIPFASVQRIFRRVERMHIRACGGRRPFASQGWFWFFQTVKNWWSTLQTTMQKKQRLRFRL